MLTQQAMCKTGRENEKQLDKVGLSEFPTLQFLFQKAF